MDDIVKAAMAKWPNVPHCYGWLGLDARGNWYMRDDRTQAQGAFPVSKGSLLKHEKLIDFIHRNYAADEQGQWFFQNGPQRVYVELEATPWIWRLQPDGSVVSHTGAPSGAISESLLDEAGRLYLVTERGVGLVHSADMVAAADVVEEGLWTPRDADASTLPSRFGFEPSPQGRQKT
ncbi:DUF2946 family protein [Hydrogenophaga sp. BPS33]|uniref:DUF2946 family protein n=1 Tax=Hydrogenophaga sp. BPS33 TaxID=2651974 RepID=UPI00132050F5|nr:DUF2946 family protein [Hydrogenophaga sp. BPS33]QHE83850.1 DUF2946 family protein [Hydrogenophaga sp. BPS33]